MDSAAGIRTFLRWITERRGEEFTGFWILLLWLVASPVKKKHRHINGHQQFTLFPVCFSLTYLNFLSFLGQETLTSADYLLLTGCERGANFSIDFSAVCEQLNPVLFTHEKSIIHDKAINITLCIHDESLMGGLISLFPHSLLLLLAPWQPVI